MGKCLIKHTNSFNITEEICALHCAKIKDRDIFHCV